MTQVYTFEGCIELDLRLNDGRIEPFDSDPPIAVAFPLKKVEIYEIFFSYLHGTVDKRL